MFKKLILSLLCLLTLGCNKPEPQMPHLTDFDAGRYLGQWYEIKRLDHSFERGVSQARAEYTPLTDGQFLVVNTGSKNGKEQQFIATAKPTDIKNFYKIYPKSFPFIAANYRIAWVDSNYQYAIVTSTSFDYLWFLSRTTDIPDEVMQQMLQISANLGFDTSKLIDGQ